MQKTMWLSACCAALGLSASDAQAQAQMLKWEDTAYVMVNAGLQAQSRSFTEISTPLIYGENALVTVPHEVSSGLLFDVAGGVRLWRNLAVGVGFSRFADKETPTLAGEIPSPLVFGSPRAAVTSTGELKHSETAVHVHALWMVPVSNKIELAAMAGPSFYRIEQDVLSGITVAESPVPPFAAVTINSVTTTSESERAVGFTVGADMTYLITRRFGAGALVRYSAASVDLTTSGGGTITVDAGGFQIGAGLRVRF